MSDNLQKCVWMWAGLLTYRLCDRNYQCAGCPVEALFHPTSTGTPEESAEEEVAGRAIPLPSAPDRFHDPQHLWIRVLPEGRVQIGLDPMAARLLQRARRIDLPRPGVRLRRGDPLATLRLATGEVPFDSPVSGEVLRAHRVPGGRIHGMLGRPYSRAWLVVLAAHRLEKQLGRFIFGRGAGLRLAQEWSRFQEECAGMASLGPTAMPVLPDGGEVDLASFEEHVGSVYPEFLRRWIGAGRLTPGRKARPERGRSTTAGGEAMPPEER